MIQSHENRVEALKSVLPLLELHHDLISRVRSALGNCWESEPSPLDLPAKPQLPEVDTFCNVRCGICPEAIRCREVAWIRMAQRLWWTYHLGPVSAALERLSRTQLFGQTRAAAVYYSYVQPWPDWNPHKRLQWAEEGLSYMAESIPVRLIPYRIGDKQTGKLSREDEIVRLREEGLSYHQIAKTVGCSKSTVSAILRGQGVRSQRAISDVS